MSPYLRACTVVSAPSATVDVSDKVLAELPAKSEVFKNIVMYGQVRGASSLEDCTWPKTLGQMMAFSSQALAIVEFLNQNMAIMQELLGR